MNLVFGDQKHTELVREADLLVKRLYKDSELKSNMPKGMEVEFGTYQRKYKSYTALIKSSVSVKEQEDTKKFRAELKQEFVGMIARMIIKNKYNIEIAIPAYMPK